MPTTNAGFPDNSSDSGRDGLVFWGPTLWVQIGFDPAFMDIGAVPSLPSQQHPALVDTGANYSCIDSALAISLSLPVVDRAPVSGVHGSEPVNFHLAQIHVPSLGWWVYGRFAGVHLSAGGQPHSAILGRVFLRDFVMFYDGRTGEVSISND